MDSQRTAQQVRATGGATDEDAESHHDVSEEEMIIEAIIIAVAILLQPLSTQLVSMAIFRMFPPQYPALPELVDPLDSIEDAARRIAKAMREGDDDGWKKP
ncbi:MAG: hypothetical protein GY906_38540 [bacterium]|nr:hypothetical protein [bacterium]